MLFCNDECLPVLSVRRGLQIHTESKLLVSLAHNHLEPDGSLAAIQLCLLLQSSPQWCVKPQTTEAPTKSKYSHEVKESSAHQCSGKLIWVSGGAGEELDVQFQGLTVTEVMPIRRWRFFTVLVCLQNGRFATHELEVAMYTTNYAKAITFILDNLYVEF
jgi:hypothetical protein